MVEVELDWVEVMMDSEKVVKEKEMGAEDTVEKKKED